MDLLKLCIFTIQLYYVDKIPFKRGDDVYHLKEYLKFLILASVLNIVNTLMDLLIHL